MPPAGQGAVALICRAGDKNAAGSGPADQPSASFSEVDAREDATRGMSKDGKGGIGVLAEFEEDEFAISAVIASPTVRRRSCRKRQGWKGDELKVIGSARRGPFRKGRRRDHGDVQEYNGGITGRCSTEN